VHIAKEKLIVDERDFWGRADRRLRSLAHDELKRLVVSEETCCELPSVRGSESKRLKRINTPTQRSCEELETSVGMPVESTARLTVCPVPKNTRDRCDR